MNNQTDEMIRDELNGKGVYLARYIGRIIHLDEISIARYDGCDLRTHYVEWIVFVDGKDVASYQTLREAKLHGKPDPRYATVTTKLKDRADAKSKLAESGAKSQHFGSIKERLTATIEVLAVTHIDSEWGTTSLYTMKSGDNVCKWFASRDALDVGETYDVKMTIKKHDEYNGVNQTVVNRVAVI